MHLLSRALASSPQEIHTIVCARYELLTSPPQTDVKSLSSSVNIVRDCPELPILLPPDLDIGSIPEISDVDDEDFPELTSPSLGAAKAEAESSPLQ